MVRSGFQLPGMPFLRLLVPLCLGAGIEQYGLLSQPLLFAALLFALIVILLLYRRVNFIYQPFWGALLFLAIACFGFVRSAMQKSVFPQLPGQRYFVVVDEFPREKEKTFQLVGQFIQSESKLLVYLQKSPAIAQIEPGDVICFKGSPQLIENEGNPFEFDYRRYMHRQKNGYRIFLKENEFFLLENERKLNLYHRAQLFRKKLVEILYHSGMSAENVPLVSSIAFGARSEVDKETIQKFTNTGVIHVLAVSGMNVGLVFVILDLILRFLKSGRVGLILYTLVILSGIWSYALITGMSASILRAALMFSFVIVGRALRRNANIFNSLAVSAFLLIAWNPSILGDIGFQLSYAAVLSIVVIQPILYKQLYCKNWLSGKIWMLLSVTFAAQFGTLPFTLYYFHQFPVYFWLANLAVIPLVTLILYLSFVVVFLASLSGFVASLFAFVLDWSVRLVSSAVDTIDSLPHSVLKGLNPALYQIVLFLLSVVLFYRYYRSRKIVLLQGGLVAAIVLSLTSGIGHFRQLTRAEILFFNVEGARVMALTSGKQVMVLYDPRVKEEVKLDYYLKPYLGARGIDKVEVVRLTDSLHVKRANLSIAGNLVYFRGIRLYVQPQSETSDKPVDAKIPADLVWVRSFKTGSHDPPNFPPTKILLYQASQEDEKYMQSHFPGRSINVNRAAVQLSFKPSFKGDVTKVFCDYFDPVYSSSRPLPCLIISASPVVQSTMVEGWLSP